MTLVLMFHVSNSQTFRALKTRFCSIGQETASELSPTQSAYLNTKPHALMIQGTTSRCAMHGNESRGPYGSYACVACFHWYMDLMYV